MAPSLSIRDAVIAAVNAAPNQRIKYAQLVADLRNAGYRNFGQDILNMGFEGVIRPETVIEDNKGVLYYSTQQ